MFVHFTHIWSCHIERKRSLQPRSQAYDLATHTTHIVCVNFIRKWWDLQFNVDSEQQIFEKLSHGRFIYSQSFCQKSAESKSPKKYFSYFIFDDWFASNKPTHYILDHGDFRSLIIASKIKANMCLVSLYCTHYLKCSCFQVIQQ